MFYNKKKKGYFMRYERKFKPGNHYLIASEAIISRENGVIGFDKNKEISISAMISKKQVEFLKKEGLTPNENGDFELSEERAEKLSDDSWKEKDKYIEENKIQIEEMRDSTYKALKKKKKKAKSLRSI